MPLPRSIIQHSPPDAFSHQLAIPSPVSGAAVRGENNGCSQPRLRLLGEGTSVRCTGNHIHAPVNALVESCPAIGYQVILRHSTGLRFYLVLGSGTERLMGERCIRLVKEGQKVTAGTPLLAVDPIWLKQQGIEPLCLLTVVPDKRFNALVMGSAKYFRAMQDTIFTLYTRPN